MRQHPNGMAARWASVKMGRCLDGTAPDGTASKCSGAQIGRRWVGTASSWDGANVARCQVGTCQDSMVPSNDGPQMARHSSVLFRDHGVDDFYNIDFSLKHTAKSILAIFTWNMFVSTIIKNDRRRFRDFAGNKIFIAQPKQQASYKDLVDCSPWQRQLRVYACVGNTRQFCNTKEDTQFVLTFKLPY